MSPAKTELPIQNEETYIGDGVYVSFDGFQIKLRANQNVVFLEPEVYKELRSWILKYPRLHKHVGG